MKTAKLTLQKIAKSLNGHTISTEWHNELSLVPREAEWSVLRGVITLPLFYSDHISMTFGVCNFVMAGNLEIIYSINICQIALAFPFKWLKMKHPTVILVHILRIFLWYAFMFDPGSLLRRPSLWSLREKQEGGAGTFLERVKVKKQL